MDLSRDDIERAARELSQRRKVFQSKHIREHLGVTPDNKIALARIHNSLKSMVRDGTIEITTPHQKRNRSFRIASPPSLETPVLATTSDGARHPPSPKRQRDRLSRMESSIRSVEDRLNTIDVTLNQILEILR